MYDLQFESEFGEVPKTYTTVVEVLQLGVSSLSAM